MIEQFQPLEFAPSGNIWLTLSVLDISPNQNIQEGVRSKLMNFTTGEMFYIEKIVAEKTVIELSPREKMILELVREGKLSKEISDELAISVHTVNTHRQRILKKLNANNTYEALNYASALGLLN